jgi:hypothetical protein
MVNSPTHRVVALTGADCFLRAFDQEVRRTSQSGHLAQLVLRLGPGFAAEQFERLLREVATANPIMSAPIRRRAMLGPPEYRLDRAGTSDRLSIEVHAKQDRHAALPPTAFSERLNGAANARNGDLLSADIVPYSDGRTDLALTWLHLLFDGAGSERFVEHLCRCCADQSFERAVPLSTDMDFAQSPNRPSLRKRAENASAWHQALLGSTPASIESPGGPLRRVPQQLSYRWTTLDRERTSTIKARSAQYAGVLTPMLFYLAAAIRGHHAVAKSRGRRPQKWLIPLPVNLRSKGTAGEMFRTHITLIWFQATAEEVQDFEGLVEALKQQRRAAIKGGLIEAGVQAMDFVRMIPSRLFTKFARRDYDGELCSFFFAFTDEFAPDASQLCGARIETGSHVPSVPPSPGSSVVMSLRDECLTLTQIRQHGAVSDEEDEIMREQMLADLTGL